MPRPITQGGVFKPCLVFFKEVDIRQGGDCCGMWLILRLEGMDKCLSGFEGSKDICPSCITSFVGGAK